MIAEARSYGDLSENSEYDAAKNEQAKLYGRIAEIEDVLSHAVIIEDENEATGRVGLGCTVVVEDENGKQTSKTEQVCCSNLIVQYAKQGVISGDYGGRRQATLVGKGEAEYFINGKHIKGYWERKTQNEATVYYTEDGEQVTFMPGNTWVEVHPADKQITVK